jgi:hypothetical protein
LVMVLDSQTQTISLILQDQRGTTLFLARNSGGSHRVSRINNRSSTKEFPFAAPERILRRHGDGQGTKIFFSVKLRFLIRETLYC